MVKVKEKRKKFKRIQDQDDSSASSSHEESDAGEEVIDLASESNSASENEDEESPDSSAAAEERRLKKQSTKKNKSKRIGDTFGSPQKHWPWKSIRFVDENSDEENEEPNDDSRTDEPVRRKKSGSKHSTDSTPVKNKLVDDGEVPGSSTGSKRMNPSTPSPSKHTKSSKAKRSTLTPHLRKTKIYSDDDENEMEIEQIDSEENDQYNNMTAREISDGEELILNSDDEEDGVIDDSDDDDENQRQGNGHPETEESSSEEEGQAVQSLHEEEAEDSDDLIARVIDPTEVLGQNPQLIAGRYIKVRNSQIEILSPTRFAVYTLVKHYQTKRKIIRYTREFVDRFSNFRCRYHYDTRTRKFIFPITMQAYNEVLSALRSMGKPPKSLTRVGNRTFDSLRKVMLAFSRYRSLNMREAEISEHDIEWIQNIPNLMDYQRETIKYAITRKGRVLLADESGMGKSAEAIMTAYFYNKEWPLLILCPKNLCKEFWKNEILKWLPKKKKPYKITILTDIQTCQNFIDKKKKPEIVIVSYSLLSLLHKAEHRDLEEKFSKKTFNVVIMDESHKIKHYYTQTSEAARSVIRQAKRRILISRNPAFGVPRELFQQLHAVDRVAFRNHRNFADRYCGNRELPDGRVVASSNWKDAENLEELKHLMHGTCIIRHFRSDYFDLPVKSREKVILNFNPDAYYRTARATLGKLHRSCQNDFSELATGNNLSNKGCNWIFRWFKKSGNAKLPSICQYLDEYNMKGRKIIIYYRHNCVATGIEKLFKKRHIDYIKLKDVSAEERGLLCHSFNHDPKFNVALLNINVARVGVDLSAVDTIIFVEEYWVPDAILMNEDRAIGSLFCDDASGKKKKKNKKIDIKYLLAVDENSEDQIHIDNHLWELMSGKLYVLSSLGLMKDNFIHDDGQLVTTHFQPQPGTDDFDDVLSEMSSLHSDNDSNFDPGSDSDGDDDNDDGGDVSEVPSEDLDSSSSSSDDDDDNDANGDPNEPRDSEVRGNSARNIKQEPEEESEEEEDKVIVGPRKTKNKNVRYNVDDEENDSPAVEVKQEEESPALESDGSEVLISNDQLMAINENMKNYQQQRSIPLGSQDTSEDEDENDDEAGTSTDAFVTPGSSETDPDADYSPTRKRRKKRSCKGTPKEKRKKLEKDELVIGSCSSSKSKHSRGRREETSSESEEEDKPRFHKKVSAKTFLF